MARRKTKLYEYYIQRPVKEWKLVAIHCHLPTCVSSLNTGPASGRDGCTVCNT